MPIAWRDSLGQVFVVDYEDGPSRTTKSQIRACELHFSREPLREVAIDAVALAKKEARQRSEAAIETRIEDLQDRGFDLSSHEADTGTIRVRCSQCEACTINGHACHEHGCPNARRAAQRDYAIEDDAVYA